MTRADFDYTQCHCCGRWAAWLEEVVPVVVRRLDENAGSYFNMKVMICKGCEEALKSEAAPVE